MNAPASASPRRRTWLVCLLLAVVTLAVYWPVTHYEFVDYDDPVFISKNPVIEAGITAQGLEYAWQAEVARNWHPLTVLSHMLDCQIFGPTKPGWHHFTNLVFHAANTLLLFFLLQRLTGAFWRSALIAALFAWHPLHVESVAWVAERKDVLSTFFWWLTLWAWVGYAGGGNPRVKSKLFYLGAVFLFVLAALSKPMVVTLPFVLLLLDFWPLRRFDFSLPGSNPPVGNATGRSISFLLLEKAPFFLIAALLCIKTFQIQENGGAVLDTLDLPISSRISNAIVSYLRYLAKMFWPHDLAALYLRHGDPSGWLVFICAVLLVAITAGVIWQARPRPYLALGWFWYLGTLVPVIGLVQVGMQTMADRYTYVPLTGIFIMLAWGGAELAARFPLPKTVPVVTAAAALSVCVLLTARQITWWQNSETLFKRMIDVTDRNYVAHYDLANVYWQENQTALAVDHYRECLAEYPDYAGAYDGLAGVFLGEHKYDEAIQNYQDSVRIKPTAMAWCNLGNAFAEAGRARHDTNLLAQSIPAFQQSLQLDPSLSATHNNFGVVWRDLKQDNRAIAEFTASIQSDPNFEIGQFNLASALYRVGRFEEAITHYQIAARLNPDRLESFNHAGLAYTHLGKMTEATEQFRRILEKTPRDSGTWDNLGNALGMQGKFDEAISCFQKALQIDPGDFQAEFRLGTSYARQNHPAEAKTHFQAALRIRPDYLPAQQALTEMDRSAK